MGFTERINLSGKMTLVTGASRGLGETISSLFFQKGSDLILIGRDMQTLIQVKELIKRERPEGVIFCYALDLNNIDELKKFSSVILANNHKIDILINNAAIQGPIGPFVDNPWEEWVDCFTVDFLAPVYLTKIVLHGMIKQNSGCIISISGGGATSARAGFSSYGSAKCALVRFSETLAEEVRPYGVTVNCVAPGPMKSKMTQEIIHASLDINNHEYLVAKKLLSEDSEVTIKKASELVLMLASDLGKGITGRLISALWDPWEDLFKNSKKIEDSDLFTLRRITLEDRGIIFP